MSDHLANRPAGLDTADGAAAPGLLLADPLVDPPPIRRVASIDVYRGGVMLLMLAEVLELGDMAGHFPDSPTWRWLGYHQSHVAWRGGSVHDMIQPSFSFLVGVALPFSIASRVRKGASTASILGHAAWRALVLVALGIFLRSVGKPRTNFTFEDTLTQIGLGYLPLVAIGLMGARARWVAFLAIVLGYWGLFAAYPSPRSSPSGFDYAAVGVPADWPHHAEGFAAHWNKNSNAAAAFDRWFLNLFPRDSGFTHNRGGYATLSFIPTLGTMLLGLVAGGWLLGDYRGKNLLGRMLAAAAVGVSAGWALDAYGICPIVKRIWTPSWVLFSGGVCFGVMATLEILVDELGWRRIFAPILVIGRNSIAAYCLAHLIGDFLASTARVHLGSRAFQVFGEKYEPIALGAYLLACYWLILWWMDRRRIYLRV